MASWNPASGGTYSVSINQSDLGDSSGIFDAVQGLITAPSNTGSFSVPTPSFTPIELNGDIGGASTGLNGVSAGGISFSGGGGGNTPNLEAASYSALSKTIDFVHNSPQVQGIAYQTGQDGGDIPDLMSGKTPPLSYPQFGQFSTPTLPTGTTAETPELVFEDRQDRLKDIVLRAYQPEPLAPVDISDIDLRYQSPDVDDLQWRDPETYDDDAGLQDQLKALMAQDGEAARWVEQQFLERLRDADLRGLDVGVKRQIDAVMEEAAAANLPAPSGPVERKVAAVAGEELDAAYKQAQAVRDEVYQASLRAVVGALQQSLKVENYHLSLYMAYVRQNLEVYKLNLQLATEAHNAIVSVFNSRLSVLQQLIQDYDRYVSAQVDQMRTQYREFDLYRAKIGKFAEEVRMYSSDVDIQRGMAQVYGLDIEKQAQEISIYRGELEVSLANADVASKNVQSFEQAIRAHAGATRWYQDAISAYEASIQASAGKAEVDEANFRAYRQLWAAENDRMSAYQNYVSSSTSRMDDEIQRFRSAVQSQREYLNSVLSAIQASVSAINDYASAWSTSASYTEEKNRAESSYAAAQKAVDVNQQRLDMARQAMTAESNAAIARLDAAKNGAKLRAAGALSQAASSVYQVSVTARGGASENIRGQDSGSRRTSLRNDRSWSRRATETVRPATG